VKVSERHRLAILGVLLAATLAVTAFSSSDDEAGGVVQPSVRKSPPTTVEGSDAQSARASIARLDLSGLTRDANETVLADLFAPKSWYVPPPPPPVAATAPPAPVAPPLPFKYVGQLGEISGKNVIYLTKGDTVYTVSVGDVFDSQYRLESVNEAQLTFTYIPMNAQQILPIPRRQ
jgi:hypothetical protein